MKTVLVTIAFALVCAVGASATTVKRYWSQTYTEKMVLAKVHVPCHAVFGPHTGIPWRGQGACDLAGARNTVALDKAIVAKATAACAADPTSPSCDDVIELGNLADANRYLGYAKNGVNVAEATCNGSGSPDATGYRFATLTCQITSSIPFTVLQEVPPKQITGRIAVWPTGVATLRWKFV